MKQIGRMLSPFLGHPLLYLMLAIAYLGGYPATLYPRENTMPISAHTILLILMIPVLLASAFCVWLQLKNLAMAWGAGLFMAMTAALFNFPLISLVDQQDIPSLLIFYAWGGNLIILPMMGWIGAKLGRFLSKSHQYKALYQFPQKPWLWPLFMPIFFYLTLTFINILFLGFHTDHLIFLIPTLILISLFSFLGFALLQTKAHQECRVRPWLTSYWGYSIGLTLTTFLIRYFLQFPIHPAFNKLFFFTALSSPLLGYSIAFIIQYFKNHQPKTQLSS